MTLIHGDISEQARSDVSLWEILPSLGYKKEHYGYLWNGASENHYLHIYTTTRAVVELVNN